MENKNIYIDLKIYNYMKYNIFTIQKKKRNDSKHFYEKFNEVLRKICDGIINIGLFINLYNCVL